MCVKGVALRNCCHEERKGRPGSIPATLTHLFCHLLSLVAAGSTSMPGDTERHLMVGLVERPWKGLGRKASVAVIEDVGLRFHRDFCDCEVPTILELHKLLQLRLAPKGVISPVKP